MKNGETNWCNTLWRQKRAGYCFFFSFFLISDMLDYRSMEWSVCVPIPFCLNCVRMSPSLVIVQSSFGPSSYSRFFLSFSTETFAVRSMARRVPFPRMLVLCVWVNLLWWRYFLYQKENCGLLGGLTFYRTCHICESEKVTKKNPFSCTGHVQTQLCTKQSPFVGPFPPAS